MMTFLKYSAAALLAALVSANASVTGGVHALAQQPSSEPAPAGDMLAFVGTYTGGESKGIYAFRVTHGEGDGNAAEFAWEPLGLAAEVASPSFLAIDADRKLLFCVNEAEIEGQRGGGVTAYRIDLATARLTLIDQQSSGGAGPCHLAIAPGGKHVVVANYGGGSVAVLPIDDGGALGEASDFVQHAGSSVNPDRQEGPHAHCVTFDPAGKFVCVCDLGLDLVLVYKYDAATGKLAANDPPSVALKPGAGPRHLAFHPNGRLAYVVNELDSTVTALKFDARPGVFEPIGSASTLPEGFDGENSTAEITVHPSGKFLYASNRGHDSVATFAIDATTGTATLAGNTSTQGQTPRNFGLTADGTLLVAANQNSGTLLPCRVLEDGQELEPSGALIAAPSPVCVVFMPRDED